MRGLLKLMFWEALLYSNTAVLCYLDETSSAHSRSRGQSNTSADGEALNRIPEAACRTKNRSPGSRNARISTPTVDQMQRIFTMVSFLDFPANEGAKGTGGNTHHVESETAHARPCTRGKRQIWLTSNLGIRQRTGVSRSPRSLVRLGP